ncbi:hypothetical protein [Bacillus gobiensis]|uniref:hypothetical protein n=1 Tax=Bacillus gobiensis TaxID=1441095 RepID=UPI003D204E0D
MKLKGVLINIVGVILCFLLFGISMVFVGQVPILTLTGIIGLTGFSYFVYRIVSEKINHQKN